MRKIFISGVIVVINLLAIYYWLIYNPSQNVYSEEIVQKAAEDIDRDFLILFNDIDTQVNIIEKHYNGNSEFSLNMCNDFFLNVLEKNKIIQSLMLLKNNQKYLVLRKNNSIISTLDTTKEFDIVKWQRFEGKKMVSEWDEVFDKSNYNLKWIDDLLQTKNEYQWLHNYRSIKNDVVLLLGKSWNVENDVYAVAMRFSKEELRKYFRETRGFQRFGVIINTQKEQAFNLTKKNTLKTDSTINTSEFISALKAAYSKFPPNEDRVFSHIYRDKMYWAAVKDIKSILAINNIIVSISEEDINPSDRGQDKLGFIYWGLLLSGSLLVFFATYRKSIFDTKKLFVNKKNVSIDNLLENNENRHLEFKSSLRWDYRQEKVNPDLELVILKTIAAFGNSDGGILLIGVDDDKNILGLENDYNTLKKKGSDFYEIYMRNLFHKYFGVKYTTENVRMDFIQDNAKEICLIEVFKADEPLYLKSKDKSGQTTEKFYVRSGNSSQQIDSLKDINDYIFDRFKKEA